MFDRKPLNHPQIRLSVRSWAPGLRNFSVITFHCLGPFPYKNALKKENSTNIQPFWPNGSGNIYGGRESPSPPTLHPSRPFKKWPSEGKQRAAWGEKKTKMAASSVGKLLLESRTFGLKNMLFDVQIPYIVFLRPWLIYLHLKGWLEKSEELWHVTRELSFPFW